MDIVGNVLPQRTSACVHRRDSEGAEKNRLDRMNRIHRIQKILAADRRRRTQRRDLFTFPQKARFHACNSVLSHSFPVDVVVSKG